MKRNIREFLRENGAEGLKSRGVLSPNRRCAYLLQGRNVVPLLEMMRERGVSKLVSHDGKWFLTVEGEFANPKSRDVKAGSVKQLGKGGQCFLGPKPGNQPLLRARSRFHGTPLRKQQNYALCPNNC